MSKRNKRIKKAKRNKKRISRSKLLILTLAIILSGMFLLKCVKLTSNSLSKIKDNVIVLAEAVFGPSQDINDVNRDKQFDLEDEKYEEDKKYVVYIDVAHGGDDLGYETRNGIKEKDLNLQISKLISNRLSSQEDISVILSRSTDTNVKSSQSVEDANKQNANVFISIDMTANNDKSANGVQTFYSPNSNNGSDELAMLVQKSVVNYVDLKDRETKSIKFDILNNNVMPAIVIQCGFLSNEDEEKKMVNPKFQKDLAEGISQGILSYLDTQS